MAFKLERKDKMKYWLKVLLTPGCWLQLYSYNKHWDEELNRLMDSGEKFKDVSSHTAIIGGYCVWIKNHPYASFTPYYTGLPEFRPSRATILRAMDKLVADVIEAKTKRYKTSSLADK